MSAQLSLASHLGSAFAVAFAFAGYLRAGELVDLRYSDICFLGDPRLSEIQTPSRAVAVIQNAKTGLNQFVSIEDSGRLTNLKHWIRWKGDLESSDPLFSLSSSQLNRRFRAVLENVHLGEVGYTLHSLMHGGDTHDFLAGRSIQDIMIRGRCQSERSLKLSQHAENAPRQVQHARTHSSHYTQSSWSLVPQLGDGGGSSLNRGCEHTTVNSA